MLKVDGIAEANSPGKGWNMSMIIIFCAGIM